MLDLRFREVSWIVQDLRLGKATPVHDWHELVLISEGCYQVSVNGGEPWLGQPDDVFIYPQGTHHELLHAHDGSCVIYLLTWTGHCPFTEPVRLADRARRILFCLQWLDNLHDSEIALLADQREALLHSVLAECLRLQAGLRLTGHDPVMRAISYLEHHLQDTQSVELVCRVAGYRPSRLFDEFQRVVGCGPMAYLSHLRARRAVELAVTSRLSLGAIARRVGLTSASHLCRLIRKEYGRPLGILRRTGSARALDPGKPHLYSAPMPEPTISSEGRQGGGMAAPPVRCVSWNVNGLRAIIGKGIDPLTVVAGSTVVGLQEVKVRPEQLPAEHVEPDGWHALWFPAQKAGYSGTVIFSRRAPDEGVNGLGEESFDAEGRVQTLVFGNLAVINAYFPNSQDGGARLDFKLAFCAAMERHLAAWRRRGCRTVLLGDYNIAHQPIDLARPRENEGSPGYLPQERAWFSRYLALGYRDPLRERHPDQAGLYSWWSYRGGARARNIGWRIDYATISSELNPCVAEVAIHPGILGSDHAPIHIDLREQP